MGQLPIQSLCKYLQLFATLLDAISLSDILDILTFAISCALWKRYLPDGEKEALFSIQSYL